MKRWQAYLVAVLALFVAAEAFVYAQPAPNNCGLNMLCRVRTLIVTGSASFLGGAVFDGGTVYNGDLTVNGDAGASGNLAVGGTTVFGSNAYLDGGSQLRFNTATHIESDGFGGLQGSFGGGANLTGNFGTTGDLNVDGYSNPKTGLRNTGTSAVCSGNAGAVCVNDTGGFAVADGAGATVAIVDNTGKGTFLGVTLSSGSTITYAGACDSTGSPGAATCNQGAGRATIAASAASVVITNSLSKTTSIIHATLQTTDAVCTGIKSLVPSNGSFAITTNAVCTGNTNVAWGFDSP